MSAQPSALHTSACRYLKGGRSVIPVGDDKRPVIPSWKEYQDHQPTQQEVDAWWDNGTSPNVAIITGAVSGNLVVLDIDDVVLAERVVADESLIHETIAVRTPRGGLHLYVAESEAQSSSGPLIPGVADLKAGGGYIIAPPSATPQGRYKTLNGGSPLRVPNGRVWAIRLLGEYGVAADTRASVTPASLAEPIPQGARNETLTRIAGSLRRHGADEATITAALVGVNQSCCNPPLPDDEVGRIATSVARYPAGEVSTSKEANEATPWTPPRSEWPAGAADQAFYGLPGEIVKVLDPHTEADPQALLINILVAFGNAVGNGPHFRVGQDKHELRLFAVLVGDTSQGRKGVSHAEIMALMGRADDSLANRRTTGLSTGEGLIWAVRDPIYQRQAIKEGGRVVDYQDVQTDPGVEDKRKFVIEPEFARTLSVMGRDGNTLSAVMRQAWDDGSLRVLTKNNAAIATGAHISVVGHISKNELLRNLDSTEAANGFANRFLWMAVKRSKVLPDGGMAPEHELERLSERLPTTLRFAANAREMSRDDEARALWHEVYPELSKGRPGLFGAITGRAPAQVVRLSCIYALMDSSSIVRPSHLLAALALWERVEATVSYVFGDSIGDPTADTILRALRDQGPMTQTAISGLLGRNVPAEKLSRALGLLGDAGLVETHMAETDGRSTTEWAAVERTTN